MTTIGGHVGKQTPATIALNGILLSSYSMTLGANQEL